jgi:hypothetical protein
MSNVLNTKNIRWSNAIRLKTKPKLKRILENINLDFSEILLSLPFKCAFSLPVFLILKYKIFYMYWEENDGKYKLALPCEINVNQLKSVTNICKNSLKKALNELLDIGLIEKIDWKKPYHSACYVVLVKNDTLIAQFDAETGKVVYNESLSFNFGEKYSNFD